MFTFSPSKLGISMFIFNQKSCISLLMQPSVPLCSGYTKVYSVSVTSLSLCPSFFLYLHFPKRKERHIYKIV